jgi:hypothetical protein
MGAWKVRNSMQRAHSHRLVLQRNHTFILLSYFAFSKDLQARQEDTLGEDLHAQSIAPLARLSDCFFLPLFLSNAELDTC